MAALRKSLKRQRLIDEAMSQTSVQRGFQETGRKGQQPKAIPVLKQTLGNTLAERKAYIQEHGLDSFRRVVRTGTRLRQRMKAINEAVRKYPEPKKLFEHVFGRKPKGPVSYQANEKGLIFLINRETSEAIKMEPRTLGGFFYSKKTPVKPKELKGNVGVFLEHYRIPLEQAQLRAHEREHGRQQVIQPPNLRFENFLVQLSKKISKQRSIDKEEFGAITRKWMKLATNSITKRELIAEIAEGKPLAEIEAIIPRSPYDLYFLKIDKRARAKKPLKELSARLKSIFAELDEIEEAHGVRIDSHLEGSTWEIKWDGKTFKFPKETPRKVSQRCRELATTYRKTKKEFDGLLNEEHQKFWREYDKFNMKGEINFQAGENLKAIKTALRAGVPKDVLLNTAFRADYMEMDKVIAQLIETWKERKKSKKTK